MQLSLSLEDLCIDAGDGEGEAFPSPEKLHEVRECALLNMHKGDWYFDLLTMKVLVSCSVKVCA